mmetsp:Transcript_6575/g.14049  ORF Transcript_6575/g.14049 Transcript_6575/m.14049 type:complete len:138 (+) Transcript_6575:76-489(+)
MQNHPLAILVYKNRLSGLPRSADREPELQMHEIVYNSLDVFDDVDARPSSESYLGKIAGLGVVSLYGWISSTRVKVVVALSGSPTMENHNSRVKALLSKIHRLSVAAMLNCFQTIDAPFHSSTLESKLNDIASTFRT